MVTLLSELDVARLLSPEEAIEASAEAFKLLSTGGAEVPLRTEFIQRDPESVALVMPGLVHDQVLGLKLIASRSDPSAPGGLVTMALVILLDAHSTQAKGVVSAVHLTDYRTAGGLAAATGVLARNDARTLAVYGAGKLSYPSIRLICSVRPIERVVLVSRTASRVAALKARVESNTALSGIHVTSDLSADEAAAEADIITTVTSAGAPVFDGSQVRPGTHINLAGAFRPNNREMDDEAAARADFFLDSAESCRARAGDILMALQSGAITEEQIKGEIGAVLAGKLPGRTRDDQITVFKSLGTAVQDLVLSDRLLARSARSRIGVSFDLGAD